MHLDYDDSYSLLQNVTTDVQLSRHEVSSTQKESEKYMPELDSEQDWRSWSWFCTHTHSIRNNNQILHCDQTGREESFYTINHECWCAICLR